MRRPLSALLAVAFFAALVAGSGRFTVSPPQPALADTNGICMSSPAPVPTGYSLPMLAACDSSHNLNVNVISGGGGSGTSGGYYQPSPTPFPTSTIAPPLLDAYGETLIAPGPHATAFNVTCVSGCAAGSGASAYYNPSPSPAPSATFLPFLVDNLGRMVLSPNSQTQAAPGWYNPAPVPLAAFQQAPANLDQFGNLQVNIVATAAPGQVSINDTSAQVKASATSQPVFLQNPARITYTICVPPMQLAPLWINDASMGTLQNLATTDYHSIVIYPGQCYTPDGRATQGEVDIMSTGTPFFTAREVQQ